MPDRNLTSTRFPWDTAYLALPTIEDVLARPVQGAAIPRAQYAAMQQTGGTYLVTYVSMTYASGHGLTTYGVYRGRLHIWQGRTPFIDGHKSERIAAFRTQSCSHFNHFEVARRFATDDAPAFDFGRCADDDY